jgi:cellulose synthase/poly-beta-1,6-N-acetylglucosamine synthase-like glycosyltransferase
MIQPVEILLYAAALAGGIPAMVFAAQILASLPRLRARRPASGRRPSVAVIVPAHDEAGVIAATIAALRAQLLAGDRLLVVADNCTDQTAAIAARAGAETVERHDPRRRGKGFALDFGVRHLARTGAREIVVVVDADCIVGDGAIDTITRLSATRGVPVQAAYLLASPPGAPATSRIAAFTSMVKTVGRPLGWMRLGGPCQLMGTGFAIPWRLLAGVNLASGALAEDLKLGMDLALAGAAPRYCPQVAVRSVLPESQSSRRAQQTRWEHGHLAMMRAYAPRLFRRAVRTRDIGLAALALDLCVPPIVALALANGVVLALAAAWAIALGRIGPLLAAGTVAGLLCMALVLAWWRWGKGLVGVRDLGAVPRFVLGKLPILLRFVCNPQVEWVRTDRPSSAPGPER